MASEINEAEEDADAPPYVINKDAQKERIRNVLQRQRLHYLSSSAVVSSSSSSSLSHGNANLLQLMKIGSTSLRRLFEMEHISLATHFNHYSGSPVTKPILLWGSDSDGGAYDPWEFIARTEFSFSSPYNNTVKNTEISITQSPKQAVLSFRETKKKRRNLKLDRTRSFRRLPKLRSWIWSGFRLRLPLRRLRVMICGRKF